MKSPSRFVDEQGVPGNLFDAGTYQEAVEVIHEYCKHHSFDLSEWEDVIERDGYMSLPNGGTIYIVSSESFPNWLTSQT